MLAIKRSTPLAAPARSAVLLTHEKEFREHRHHRASSGIGEALAPGYAQPGESGRLAGHRSRGLSRNRPRIAFPIGTKAAVWFGATRRGRWTARLLGA